jgi:hypothetical protein
MTTIEEKERLIIWEHKHDIIVEIRSAEGKAPHKREKFLNICKERDIQIYKLGKRKAQIIENKERAIEIFKEYYELKIYYPKH